MVSNFKFKLVLAFTLFFSNILSMSYADSMKALINDGKFSKDATLSHQLGDYFLINIGQISNSGPANDISFRYGYDASKNSQLWVNHVKPECDRLTQTYEESYISDVNKLKSYDEKIAHSKLRDQFSKKFDTSIFRLCREYKQSIENYLVDDLTADKAVVGYLFHLKRAVKQYAEMYDNISGEEPISLFRAFKNQNSGKLTSRLSVEEDIRIQLTWLADLGVDTQVVKSLNKQFNDTKEKINSLMEKYRGDISIESRSVLPMASAESVKPFEQKEFSKPKYEKVRESLTQLFEKKYRVDVKEIKIQDEQKNNLKRFVIKKGQLVAQDFSAMPFLVLIDLGNSDEISVHRAWYEQVSDSEPDVFLYPDDANLKTPRVDQIFSTIEPKSLEQKRAERNADFENEQNKNDAEIEAKRAKEVADYKKAAEDEAARLRADAEKQMKEIRSDNYASSTSFSLIKLLSGLLLIIGGVLLASDVIFNKLSKGAEKSARQLLEKLEMFRGLLGLVISILAVFSLLAAIVYFDLISVVIAAVSVSVGLALSNDNKLYEFSYIQPIVDKAQLYAAPVGLIGIVVGLLSTIGVL